jgi:ribosomal protein L12E/L44/L45/RPP1/RPP2
VVGSLVTESLPEDLPTTATTTATTAIAGAATTTTSGEATNGDNVMAHVDGDDKDVDEESEQEQVQVLTRCVSCSSPERPLTSAFTIPKS